MKYVSVTVVIFLVLCGSYSLGYMRGEEVRRCIEFDKSWVQVGSFIREMQSRNVSEWDKERILDGSVKGLDFGKWYYDLWLIDSKSNKREAQFVKQLAASLAVNGHVPYCEVMIISRDSSVLSKKALTEYFGQYTGRVNEKDGWAIIQTRKGNEEIGSIKDERIEKLAIIANYK